MTKLSLKIAICTTFLVYSVVRMHAAESEISGIVETALNSRGLAAKALLKEKAFRETTISQIDALRNQLHKAQQRQNVEVPEIWRSKVLTQIKRDKETTAALNLVLKPLIGGTQVRFSVKTNKIAEILGGIKLEGAEPLNGVEQLLAESFFELLEGKIPYGYIYDQPTVTILGGGTADTVWGNSRGSVLKAALMYMLANREEGPSKAFGDMDPGWYDRSALAHVAPLPEGLNLDLSGYSFVCPYQPGGGLGLVLPHSGYAFGGHRLEARYPEGRPFGPHDCSSGLAYLAGSPSYTTADQICTFRKLSGWGFIPPNWESGNDARYLLENMIVVPVQDPQKDIRSGQIYSHRFFANTETSTMETLGIGGHTAITLGVLRDGNVVTIGYNRNMPKLEGFGLQNFSWAPEPLMMKMLFKVRS